MEPITLEEAQNALDRAWRAVHADPLSKAAESRLRIAQAQYARAKAAHCPLEGPASEAVGPR